MGVGGVVTLAVLWVGVQEWARRETPGATPDTDMLQQFAGHCHGCAHEGACAGHETTPGDCTGNA